MNSACEDLTMVVAPVGSLLDTILAMATNLIFAEHISTIVIIHEAVDDTELRILEEYLHLMPSRDQYVVPMESTEALAQDLEYYKGLPTLIVATDPDIAKVLSSLPPPTSRWLEQSHWLLPSESLDHLGIAALRLNNRVVFYSIDEEDSVSLEEVYSISKGKEVVLRRSLGKWNAHSPIQVPRIWSRRNDFRGATITSCVVPGGAMLNSLQVDPDSGEEHWTGYFPAIMSMLAEELNFTLNYMKQEDSVWGGKDPNTGEWLGMIGTLARGEADVGSAGLTVTRQRQEGIDFTISILDDDVVFVMLESPPQAMNIWAYVDVVTVEAFLGVVSICALLAIGMFSLGIFFGLHAQPDSEAFTLQNIIGVLGLALLQMDYQLDRSRLATKIAWLSIAAFAFVTFSYYDANLTSRMTVSSPQPLTSTFTEALENGNTVLVFKNTAYHELLAKAPMGTPEHKVYQQMLANPSTITPTTGKSSLDILIPPLQSHSKAVLFTGSHILTISPRLISSNKPIYGLHVGLGLQKDSELREVFNYHLTKIITSGVLQKLYNDFRLRGEPERILNIKEDSSGTVTAFRLGYDNLMFPFYIVLVGIVTSLAILVLENWKGGIPNKKEHMLEGVWWHA